MRLVTYDRGGARRLGAWVGTTVVDLPDAVGHPAFPSSMEALLARHGGTTLEAARAALDQPDVLAEFTVRRPRLLAPIVPTSVWRAPAREGEGPAPVTDPLDRQIELVCVLSAPPVPATGGRTQASIFGYALVDWWDEGFGPTIVTADEVDPDDPALIMVEDGRPWMRVSFDPDGLRWTVTDLAAREAPGPGAVLIFEAWARPFRRMRRGRVRPGSLVDLEPDRAQALRRVAGTS